MRKLVLAIICLTVLTSILARDAFCIDFPIRIRGGAREEYEDSNGNIWYPAQKAYSDDDWGGYVGNLPNTTIDEGAKNVVGNDTEYDDEIFMAVSWQTFPGTVNIDVNTGNGTFTVIYLVGEHWSPNNRGYNIIIEDEVLEEGYVTPGADEIDVLTFEGIEVNDSVMNFIFEGNPDTGAGDLNPMFSGLVINAPEAVISSEDKLPSIWGSIKNSR